MFSLILSLMICIEKFPSIDQAYYLDVDLNIDTDQLNNTTERELYYYDAITISHSGTTEVVDDDVGYIPADPLTDKAT